MKSIYYIAEISGNLEHPRFVGIRGAAGKVHSTDCQFHDKEQVDGNQSTLGPDFDRREVHGSQDIPMGLEEALPSRLSFSIRYGIDAMDFQNSADAGIRSHPALAG
jgi:hypothetical protein